MFEGIYFQFPKLGFLLFFFLACEALCPLRSNPLYFPRIGMFGGSGVKNPLWLWIAKWAMISLLIVAVMSPVRDKKVEYEGNGDDILFLIDTASINRSLVDKIALFVQEHPHDRFGVRSGADVIIPLTYEHDVLISMLRQVRQEESEAISAEEISRFFATSAEGKKYAIILSEYPKSFVGMLPSGVEGVFFSPADNHAWNVAGALRRVEFPHHYFDFYYVYPLFLAFLAMLAYLYGRNQKGLK